MQSMPSFKHLMLSRSGAISTVTLNRPEVRNAFNEEVIAELTQAFLELGARVDVRCIVLAAAGTAFCAGADLNWMRRMADYSHEENLADAGALAGMLRTLYECPKATIARVQGDVYAGGTGLVAACDMAVAASGVQFCLSETRLGMIPATVSPYVIRAMGARAAHRWFLTAERFGADEALRIGLVHEVVPLDQLDASVARLTSSLLAASTDAVASCKRLIQHVAGREIDQDLSDYTAAQIADSRVSADGREGQAAFLGKRKPGWQQA